MREGNSTDWKFPPRWLIVTCVILCTVVPVALSGVRISSRPTARLVALERVAGGLNQPLLVTHAGDGSGRLFIVEQVGRIRIVKDGVLLPNPFLDIQSLVSCCGEQGLLGLAFHPRYAENGLFYINYTDTRGDTIVARYAVSDNADGASTRGVERLIFIDQPYSNHNGGHLAFGPDGFLYIGTGDGGAAGDPQNNGQNVQSSLGKLLRIDVNSGSPYSIPLTNPFVGRPGMDEIWAYGLRNPWRFSFDRETGDLYIGDVGQNKWEEVDFQPAGSAGGQDYGWKITEGFHCFSPPDNCNQTGLTLPIHEYSHEEGCSVTGGYVYRGSQIPNLVGTYVFGDYCSGTIWGLKRDASGQWTRTELLRTNLSISSFGEDEAGEVYVIDLRGDVYRIKAT
ncbi:MAG: PQQ-dependent sugar dehydrogenase [Acidobacteria bacterium]|nr:PQQ-dependent sugar dehydrogenase [Acidobacteriota bacterium]